LFFNKKTAHAAEVHAMKPVQWALFSAGLITFAMATPSCDVDCVTTLTCDPPMAQGMGGASGSQSSPASQASTGAEGGGGAAMASSGAGGAGCVGEQGTGKDKTSCDAMSITPSSVPGGTAASVCGPNMNAPPPGYPVCQHGFDVLTPGVAEDLQSCLSNIGGDATNACDTTQVTACVSGSLKDACDRPEAMTRCEDTSQLCKTGTLNVALCASNLRALNDATLDEYTQCMQSGVDTKDCQVAHDDCYDMLLSS
jgi:hypothetical protein